MRQILDNSREWCEESLEKNLDSTREEQSTKRRFGYDAKKTRQTKTGKDNRTRPTGGLAR
jgi:hypothetical protein